MGEEGTDIWRALRANAELSFQMKCADFKHDSEWIPDEAASFTQLHSVDFCESSPPKNAEKKNCVLLFAKKKMSVQCALTTAVISIVLLGRTEKILDKCMRSIVLWLVFFACYDRR